MLNQAKSPSSEKGRNSSYSLAKKFDNKKSRGSNKRGSTMKNFFKQQKMEAGNPKIKREQSYSKRLRKTKTIDKKESNLSTIFMTPNELFLWLYKLQRPAFKLI
jgi:hypothetical protein